MIFSSHDLVQSPPFLRTDLISCRNLLIYFKQPLQERVLHIFHYSLNPSGILFLGKSESVSRSQGLFRPLNMKAKLFERLDVASHPIRLASGRPFNEPARQPTTAGEVEKPSGFSRALGSFYIPPSIVATVDGEVLEFIGDCSPYVSVKPGRADFNLFSIVSGRIRPALRAYVQGAARDSKSIKVMPIQFSTTDDGIDTHIRVRRIEGTSVNGSPLVAVSFEPVAVHAADGAEETELSTADAARFAEVERELQITRENLQTVIEELETSNEELQALNEEAQATNEELQATNEELETNNEELQASNEELSTVNDELSSKSVELSVALDDMGGILDSVDKAILVVDSDLTIRRHNAQSIRFFQIDIGFPSVNLMSIATHFDYPGLLQATRGVIDSGREFRVDFAFGKEWCALEIFPYRKETQKSLSAVITITDITHRKRSEQSLVDAKESFERLLQSVSHGVLGFDREGRVTYVNKSALALMGRAETDVVGSPWHTALEHSHDGKTQCDLSECPLASAVARGPSIEVGTNNGLMLVGTEDTRHVEFALTPLVGAGENAGGVLTFWDITERMARDAMIIQQNAYMAMAETVARLGHWRYTCSTGDLYASPIVYENLKRDITVPFTSAADMFSNWEGSETVDVHAAFEGAVAGDTDFDMVAQVIRQNGTVGFFRVIGTREFSVDGKVSSVFGIIQDVTAARRSELAVAAARDHAIQSNQAKSRFLSRMSHELRTPLNAVLGFAQLLRADERFDIEDDASLQIDQILSGGWHLLDLVEDVLDLARIESGRFAVSPTGIALETAILEPLAEVETALAKRSITVMDKIQGSDLPQVFADRKRLRQVLTNLFTNATKYNRPNGTITIDAEPIGLDYLRVSVADTGVGIARDDFDKVFTPFVRLTPIDTEIEGSGVGLSVAKELVELMGGAIGFSSIQGKGSTFWIDLPLLSADKMADHGVEAASIEPNAPGTLHTIENAEAPKRVIYVEDNRPNLDLMRSIMSTVPGILMIPAHTAELAIVLARHEKPDLMIFDVNLPGMSGTDAVRILRLSPETANVPMVALSVDAHPKSIEKALAAGFDDYFVKPFRVDQFLSYVTETLAETRNVGWSRGT